MSNPCFLHVDLDAFFASVEQLDYPELKGKPVIVGGKPTDRRGVVSTCSYEARKFGVHSAMPTAKAYQLCPHGIFLRGRMERYHEKSSEVMSIFSSFSPDVQQMSIDEAFLDISGTERLFGPPQDVAKKLKQTVLEQTGLTVSVGVASNKYIAKIASGLSKPDGLHIVPFGQEESFMLSLPLSKVWGVGTKTQEKLKNAGFLSVKDVHKSSLQLLVSIFGQCTGNFLYSAVRGKEAQDFSAAPKSRSISSERTFSYDLVDIYPIETALMELSYEVMFRLLSENLRSKTVHVKIRYEDFTTVSVQETTSRIISSADDLYNRVLLLFRKKYETGKGIRLLGVGTQNLEDGNVPSQGDLFDFQDKKTRMVEKTIFEIQQKNPKSKVKKARLLDTKKLVLFLASTFLFCNTKATSQTFLKQLPVEAPTSIYSFGPEDAAIEFLAEGSWESSLTGTFTISGNSDKNLTFSPSLPVFKQKTDLNLWFLLLNHWYFEASVAEDFDKSTVAAGYYGENSFKHGRIGNRYITFPDIYGISHLGKDIGSGSNQAPGIMAQWEGEDWKADILLRYDMLGDEEKNYYGMNEVGKKNISLSDWEQGLYFVLPSGFSVNKIESIFVEDSKGSYTDSKGRKFTILADEEYIILPNENAIMLSSSHSVTMLATFYSSDNGFSEKNTLIQELGSYGSLDEASSGFLGDIQKWFGSEINLKKYSSEDGKPDALFTTLYGNTSSTSEEALILQETNYFTPFVNASYYNSGATEIDDGYIVDSYSGNLLQNYGIQIMDTIVGDFSFVSTDFFKSKNLLVSAYSETDTSNPGKQFPLAKEFPLIYLIPSGDNLVVQPKSSWDISLQIYSEVTILDIGQNAIPSSVRVYRNGVQENIVMYNPETGTVQLSKMPATYDKIRITWKEYDENAQLGTITFGAGFKKDFGKTFSFSLSSALMYPYTQDNYFTTSTTSAPGSATIALNTALTKGTFNLNNTFGISYEKNDVTDSYRILGMDSGENNTVYLKNTVAIPLPSTFIPVLNSKNEVNLFPTLLAVNKGSLTEKIYTKDTGISGYAVVYDWDFTSLNGGTEEKPYWVAQTIELTTSASELLSAGQFSIALKNANASIEDYDVYLQLGATSESTFFYEDSQLPTWCLTDATSPDIRNSIKTDIEDWQTATVYLTEEDKAHFASHKNARIIIVSSEELEGSLFVGPYEVSEITFSVTKPETYDFYTEEVKGSLGITTPEKIAKFNLGAINKSQHFYWDIPSASIIETNTITARRFVDQIPLQSYSYLSLFIFAPSIATNAYKMAVTLRLKSEEKGLSQNALELELDKDALDVASEGWVELKIDLQNSKVFIDTTELDFSLYTLYINTDISPSCFELDFVLPESIIIGAHVEGELYIDELQLDGNKAYGLATDKLDIKWTFPGTIFKIKELPVLSNLSLDSQNQWTYTNAKQAFQTSSKGSIFLYNTKLSSEIKFIQNFTTSTPIILSLGHEISSTPKGLLYRYLSVSEKYQVSPEYKTATKSDFIQLVIPLPSIPVTISTSSEAKNSSNFFVQKVASIIKIQNPKFIFDGKLSAEQKTAENFQDWNYTDSWIETTENQFSLGEPTASKRSTTGSITNSYSLFDGKLIPSLQLGVNQTYNAGTTISGTGTDYSIISFSFPILSQRWSIRWLKKSGTKTSESRGGSYIEDMSDFGQYVHKRLWAYTAIPFYDFFDSTLHEKMISTSKNNSEITLQQYNSSWEISWRKPISGTPWDLCIPSNIKLSLNRDLLASSSDFTDIFQGKLSFNLTSFNNFGVKGVKPLFTWYEQDECLQTWTFTYKQGNSKNKTTQFAFKGYSEIGFYITDSNSIHTSIDSEFTTADSGYGKISTQWKRKGKTSFILNWISHLFPHLELSDTSIKRTTGAFYKFAINDSIISHNAAIEHNTKMSFNSVFSAQIGLSTELIRKQDFFSIENTVSISGKFTF